jgi:FSR family fosmidomycin resistance protein-like MFS transporter
MRRSAVFLALLIGVDFMDELSSGIPSVGSPDIQTTFGVSYGQAAGWLLTALGLLAVVLEPPLFLLADRYPRRWFVCGGLATLALTCVLAGLAPTYWVLVVALLLFGPASGCGVGVSQATLMDARPDARERMMVRWTLAGELGDLAMPGFLALVVWLGGSWRHAFLAVAGMLFVYAARLWRGPYPARRDVDGPEPSLWRAFGTALREPRLLPWIVGVLLCSLLDEIVVAFGALYLRDVVGADVNVRAVILSAFVAGGAVGLVGMERVVARFEPRRLLLATSLASAIAYCVWLSVRSPLASGVAFFAVGLFTCAHYPIAKAQAYRVLPERSGTVNAVLTAAGVVQLPVPILIGLVADGMGLVPALALLLAQPIGLAAIALATLRRDGRSAGFRSRGT